MRYCEHICTSDCRKDGCNCSCGEYHLTKDEQLNLALAEEDAYETYKNQEIQALNAR